MIIISLTQLHVNKTRVINIIVHCVQNKLRCEGKEEDSSSSGSRGHLHAEEDIQAMNWLYIHACLNMHAISQNTRHTLLNYHIATCKRILPLALNSINWNLHCAFKAPLHVSTQSHTHSKIIHAAIIIMKAPQVLMPRWRGHNYTQK